MARPSPPVHGLPEPDQVHNCGSCDCGAHPSAQRQLPSTPEMDTQMFVKVTASAIVEQVRFRVTQQRVVAGLQRTNSCYVLRTGTTCVGSNAEDVNVTQMQWVCFYLMKSRCLFIIIAVFTKDYCFRKFSKHSESFADHLVGDIILCASSNLKYNCMNRSCLKWHDWPETMCQNVIIEWPITKTFRNFRNLSRSFGNNSPSWKWLIIILSIRRSVKW